MKSNYKNIGEFIKQIDVRNQGLRVQKLVGLSISKEFIPSVANIIGTDMENYKIIKRNQFACSTMQVRRDKKMPVALFQEDEAIISQAYPVFEVKDQSKLLPEYLMMWFTREEFDREACFHAVGGVRGSLEWEDFETMKLPVPKLETQKSLVAEYKTIQDRINLNKQFIQKLEETVQTIYKEWFVASIDPENLPDGWEVTPFTKAIKLSGGGTPSTEISAYWGGEIPFYTPGDLKKQYYCIQTEKHITSQGLAKCSSKLYPANTSFVTARGATTGGVGLAGVAMAMNQTCYAISSRNTNHYYAHQLTLDTIFKLKNEAIGAIFEALVTKDFDSYNVIYASDEKQEEFNNRVTPIYELLLVKNKEVKKLEELKNLLLAKMASV